MTGSFVEEINSGRRSSGAIQDFLLAQSPVQTAKSFKYLNKASTELEVQVSTQV
jgi:hypothetical protein